MSNVIKAACIQLNNGADIEENLKVTSEFVREAAGQGAQLIATPENTGFMVRPLEKRIEMSPLQGNHITLHAMQSLAKELDVTILIGSLSVNFENQAKPFNRSFLISQDGDIAATYDKIHLFDVDLPNVPNSRESDVIAPGKAPVVADVTVNNIDTKIGMSVCYDVRFPILYNKLARQGAEIITIPAAFSMLTGEREWELFVRNRASETQSFVMAPGQAGEHSEGHSSWGHSMIVDPWGRVLAEADGKTPGVIIADLDMDVMQEKRQAIPVRKHEQEAGLTYD